MTGKKKKDNNSTSTTRGTRSTKATEATKNGDVMKSTGNTKTSSRKQRKPTKAVNNNTKLVDESVALQETLLKEISDNPEIKQGLFPSPGTIGRDEDGNPITRSNSLPKSEYYFMLATAVFGNETSKYYAAFDLESCVVKNYKKWKEIMGQTGEGLTLEDQIDMSLSNSFTTAWSGPGKAKKNFPYYFIVREIVGEHPNITPVGLGNAKTPIDTSFLHENTISSPECYGSPVWSDAEGNDEDEDKEEDKSDNSDEETPGKSESIPMKRKRGDSMDQTISAKPRRGPKQATLEKAVKPMQKSTNPLDRFADISKAEEATLQKKIDLHCERGIRQRGHWH
ncbi:hypothetical protein EV359DRAFT_65448 [Lentinula novae-zelandiae]|nr:hypothetical protein EV359DRAFT_65448 [Lentinula novae-zelandiae]